MIDLFLKAKHWQLFTLMFGIPFGIQIISMVSMIARSATGLNPDPEFMLGYFGLFPLIMVLFMGTFFGWFWSVAIGLQKLVPETVIMKVRKFKIFFFIPMTYMLFIQIVMVVAANNFMEIGTEPNAGVIGGIVGVVMPLHLFSMFCIFYSLYFVAKTFKTVELQREVKFADFAGEFFMIWFYPIGIWIIQPKINNMIEKENE